MRKLLLVLVVLASGLAVGTGSARAEGDFWRESGRACVFGGAVLGISAALVLYPAIVSGATTLPASTLIIGNTIFGCGVAALGALASHGFGLVYDQLFPPEPVMPRLAPGPAPLQRMRDSVI